MQVIVFHNILMVGVVVNTQEIIMGMYNKMFCLFNGFANMKSGPILAA